MSLRRYTLSYDVMVSISVIINESGGSIPLRIWLESYSGQYTTLWPWKPGLDSLLGHFYGGVAQMVERALCMREAAGSMPAISTTFTSYSKFIKSKQGCEHRYYCGFNSHSIIQHTRCEKIKLFIIYII